MSGSNCDNRTWYHRHRDELFIALQRLIPQHLSSRLLGKIADSEIVWLKDRLIKQAIRRYGINLEEAEITDLAAYSSFNAFFTRKLSKTARPIDTDPLCVVSPADGAISQIGQIQRDQIFQAKGRQYSGQALLGCSTQGATAFSRGSFATIYLSPRDYHRVHMPFAGKLVQADYIPGKIFSVNATTTKHVERLFARNERLVCRFDTDLGQMAVILVGALFVAGIETVWQKHYLPGKARSERFDPPVHFDKGDELGLFKFGSTVIILTENRINWQHNYAPEEPCRMGGALGFSDSR